MDEVRIVPNMALGHGFISGADVPEGADENYLRDLQSADLVSRVRALTGEEIDRLVRNANTADDWRNVRVSDEFDPRHVRNCEFYGLVRIGRVRDVHIEYHDMHVPAGLTNSRIIACDIGDDCAIHNVPYLAHYVVGEAVILLNIDEMHTTDHAKFGNGIVKSGEDESVRVTLSVINEAGGRNVMPFDGMTPGDAYLWACYRGDRELVERLGQITQAGFDARRGWYGTVAERCVIKNCRIIKDVNFGPHAYVKGANKLKNLTINSSPESPSQIGEGVEMVNGIVGEGCSAFYGCKAVRFVMGPGSNLKYGARLIHSVLGDNSTVSCCEVLNNLIFPCHEQHHNNSFLIASLVMGQSNLAASATIGSNHNSRAPDGELLAGRGFWPGLCVSTRHNCRFASFTLLAKGDYPAELDVPLPFSLVSNSPRGDRLVVMPGYWWQYNLYALERNAAKLADRDRRVVKAQKIEFDYLAPDTAEEMFTAMDLLAEWTAAEHLRAAGRPTGELDVDDLRRHGHELLRGEPAACPAEVPAPGIERSSRPVVAVKVRGGYQAYREMLHYYAISNLLDYLDEHPKANLATMSDELAGPRQTCWANVGGQLIPSDDVDAVRSGIVSGQFDSWEKIHTAWQHLWDRYARDKQRHAYATLLAVLEVDSLGAANWRKALTQAAELKHQLAQRVRATRQKDFEDPFRGVTYRDEADMTAVLGCLDDSPLVRAAAAAAVDFESRVRAAIDRVSGC